MSVSNMKTAVLLWMILAFGLFLAIFYYHPKSYTGIVPFRTVSVVAQTSGPVTEVYVQNGQRIEKGDILFQIENGSQKAALNKAFAAFQKLDANEAKARNNITIVEANIAQANTVLTRLQEDLANAEILLKKRVIRVDAVRKKASAVERAGSVLAAAQAQLSLVQTEITKVLPAARKIAEADHESAKVALARTSVKAFAGGVVTQMVLSVGSPASQLIISPAMVIIPNRDLNLQVEIVAGFSQVTKGVIYVGMPAEIACDSNSNVLMKNSVMAARVTFIQPAIAIGQVTPSGTLIEVSSRARRGSLLVGFKLVHKKHQSMMLDGSGCIVQTYTDNLHGTVGHIIAATGVIKALLLRTKVWGVLIAGVGLAGGSH